MTARGGKTRSIAQTGKVKKAKIGLLAQNPKMIL
jgi:hypothetical protein